MSPAPDPLAPRRPSILEHLVPWQRGFWWEGHESDLSVAREVTQARLTEALKVGAETYEGELEMDYLSRLSPIKITPQLHDRDGSIATSLREHGFRVGNRLARPLARYALSLSRRANSYRGTPAL